MPHHKPKVKRVIHLCWPAARVIWRRSIISLSCARWTANHAQSITEGQPIAQLQGKRNNLTCLGPQHDFQKFGQSGQHICNLFPHIGSVADDIAVIRSLTTDAINHDPAHTLMNTGTTIGGRPSMGSWMLYGLGAETENLPGYCVLISRGGGQDQPVAARQWHAGFCPAVFRACSCGGRAIPFSM